MRPRSGAEPRMACGVPAVPGDGARGRGEHATVVGMAVAGRRQHGVRLAGFDRSLGAHAVRARRDTLHRAMTARPSLAAPAIRAISRKLAAIIGPGEAREPAARASSEMSHAPGARSDRRHPPAARLQGAKTQTLLAQLP